MNIKDKLKELPKSPGVYHFLDENGVVLYVGKAKNLKNRLKQYFLKELGRGPAIEQMVQKATDIKWIETESEIEAVLLEAELINSLKPKYNVRLKDDKSFLVIKITKKISNSKFLISNKIPNPKNQKTPKQVAYVDEFLPCVELVRFKNIDLKDKSAWYFGPYPAGELLKKSLRYLRKIFPFRDCSKTKFNTYARKGRTCIYGDLGVCTGSCVRENMEESQQNIRYLMSFLKGKKGQIIKTLEKEMAVLSKKQEFEKAAKVRNQLLALGHLKNVAIGLRDEVFDSSKIMFKRIECYDISNLGEKFAVGSMVVFIDGKPDKDEYRKFKVKGDGEFSGSDLERLRQVLERRFVRNDWPMPDLVIIDGGEMQLAVAKDVLKKLDLKIALISISKGAKRKNNDFHYTDSNVAKYIEGNQAIKDVCISARDESHRFAISYYRKLHAKDLFEA